MNALILKHKSGFMDGRLLRPPTRDPNEKDWITCNSMVMLWILNSLNKEFYENVVYHDIAQGIWKDLKECFS